MIVLITYLLLLLNNVAMCQIGAFNMNPDQSAELDLSSTNKGLLIPRVILTNNLTDPSPVSQPATGLLIFNIGNNQQQGFYYWTGSSWSLLKSPTGNEISGPSSSTDNAVVRFDGTTGKVIQNSVATIDDLANIELINSISVNGFTLTTSPSVGKILVSDASGVASWQSAPPIDIEHNDTIVTTNANQLNFEGGSNVFEGGNNKAIVRFYYNNVTNDVIQLSCDDSLNLNVISSYVTIPWDIEQERDYSTFVHSNSDNPSRIQVLTKGIYEINYMFSIISKTVTRKTLRAQLLKNGTEIIPHVTSYSFSYQDSDMQTSQISCSFLIQLDANDYIELITNGQTNSGDLVLIPNENIFFMSLIKEL